MICFHDWSKWSAVEDTNYNRNKRQFRYCSKCNKVSSRVLKLGYEHLHASYINKLIEQIKVNKFTCRDNF